MEKKGTGEVLYRGRKGANTSPKSGGKRQRREGKGSDKGRELLQTKT